MSTSESFDSQTARSYAMVGLIFYLLGAATGAITFLWGGVFMGYYMGGGMMSSFPWMGGFQSASLVISLVFAVWSWITLKNIDENRFQDAHTSSLILGIFGLIFAWLIGGIFFLLAYGKIGDILRNKQITETKKVSQEPSENIVVTGNYCSQCGKVISENDKFCRYCGNQIK